MNIEKGDVWLLMLERYNVNEIAEAAGVSHLTAVGLMRRAATGPATSDHRPERLTRESCKLTAPASPMPRETLDIATW
jgi:hypothetical protein